MVILSKTHSIAYTFGVRSIIFTWREIIWLAAKLFWFLRGIWVWVSWIRIAWKAVLTPPNFILLFNAVSKEFLVGIFQEWNIDGCSELAFLPTPCLCYFCGKTVFWIVLEPFFVLNNKFPILVFFLKELFQSALFFINVQVDILFNHLWHLFDVVKHIHVLISQFIFIAIRFLWFFIFHQWLRFWELNE